MQAQQKHIAFFSSRFFALKRTSRSQSFPAFLLSALNSLSALSHSSRWLHPAQSLLLPRPNSLARLARAGPMRAMLSFSSSPPLGITPSRYDPQRLSARSQVLVQLMPSVLTQPSLSVSSLSPACCLSPVARLLAGRDHQDYLLPAVPLTRWFCCAGRSAGACLRPTAREAQDSSGSTRRQGTRGMLHTVPAGEEPANPASGVLLQRPSCSLTPLQLWSSQVLPAPSVPRPALWLRRCAEAASRA